MLLCGRYEGVDQRVIEARGMEEVSDRRLRAVGRRTAGAGAARRHGAPAAGRDGRGRERGRGKLLATDLLEYPHYTRPAEWQGRRVPDVLLSGNHAAIAAWRRAEAERVTRERRPDLWDSTHQPLCGAGCQSGGRALSEIPTKGPRPMNIIQRYEAEQIARLTASRGSARFRARRYGARRGEGRGG